MASVQSLPEVEGRSGGNRRWLPLITLALGTSLVIMDATVVNVALPVVIDDLRLGASSAQWLNAVYSLVFASLMLTVGRFGDLYGRRRLFVAGLVLFMAASVIAGAAGGPGQLIGGRLVQGIGAAMILPSALSTLNATFTGRDRAIAFATWGATIGGMAAVGPLIGGWLATEASWRWAFWLNIPVGLAVLAGALGTIPESRDSTLPRGVDLGGAVLATLGMLAVVFGLIEGQHFGWWRQESGALSPVLPALGVGAVLLLGLVFRQRSRARAGRIVLVDLTLFRLPGFRYGTAAALVVALGEFGLLFTLPLLLQGALGYSALGTGVLILVLATGTFLISAATPQLTRRFGARAIVRAGLALEAAGAGGLALTLRVDVPGAVIAAWLFTYGVGVGLATAQLTRVILTGVNPADSGQASGLQTTIRQLGAALGVALLGGLLLGTLAAGTRTALAESGIRPTVREEVVALVRGSAGAAIPRLAADPDLAPAVPAAERALVRAGRFTAGAASGVLLLGLLAPGRPGPG
ncbi:MAG: MFS transporter [Kineosporiaceae bacterium]